jgi:hypothetical protein
MDAGLRVVSGGTDNLLLVDVTAKGRTARPPRRPVALDRREQERDPDTLRPTSPPVFASAPGASSRGLGPVEMRRVGN